MLGFLFPDGINHSKINSNLHSFHLTTNSAKVHLFHHLAGPCRYLFLWLTPHPHDHKLKNSRSILSIWFLFMVISCDNINTHSSTTRKCVITNAKVIWILGHYFIWPACEYWGVLVTRQTMMSFASISDFSAVSAVFSLGIMSQEYTFLTANNRLFFFLRPSLSVELGDWWELCGQMIWQVVNIIIWLYLYHMYLFRENVTLKVYITYKSAKIKGVI